MRIALVGCGFVADYYMKTLPGHPELELLGAYDRNPARLKAFAAYHKVPAYRSLDDLLNDGRVQLVVNLTNPRSHYEVSAACLAAGKHVYSEKPLAMQMPEARTLVETAERLGLYIASAPCSLLGETAQTVWRALRQQTIGQVRLVYAEMDEGMVFKMPYRRWISESGAPWPYKDEFEVGTTVEHAGYVVTWLPAFFGPATAITGFASTLVPDKQVEPPLDTIAPDFATAVIQFASGVVVRLTCSLIARHNHALQIFGDKGTLRVDDTWYYTAPVYVRRSLNVSRRHIELPWRKLRLAGKGARYHYRGTQQMDFARGVAELAAAAREHRPCRLSARYSLHCNEIVLAVQNARAHGGTYLMTTTLDQPVEPMPWAGRR